MARSSDLAFGSCIGSYGLCSLDVRWSRHQGLIGGETGSNRITSCLPTTHSEPARSSVAYGTTVYGKRQLCLAETNEMHKVLEPRIASKSCETVVHIKIHQVALTLLIRSF